MIKYNSLTINKPKPPTRQKATYIISGLLIMPNDQYEFIKKKPITATSFKAAKSKLEKELKGFLRDVYYTKEPAT